MFGRFLDDLEQDTNRLLYNFNELFYDSLFIDKTKPDFFPIREIRLSNIPSIYDTLLIRPFVKIVDNVGNESRKLISTIPYIQLVDYNSCKILNTDELYRYYLSYTTNNQLRYLFRNFIYNDIANNDFYLLVNDIKNLVATKPELVLVDNRNYALRNGKCSIYGFLHYDLDNDDILFVKNIILTTRYIDVNVVSYNLSLFNNLDYIGFALYFNQNPNAIKFASVTNFTLINKIFSMSKFEKCVVDVAYPTHNLQILIDYKSISNNVISYKDDFIIIPSDFESINIFYDNFEPAINLKFILKNEFPLVTSDSLKIYILAVQNNLKEIRVYNSDLVLRKKLSDLTYNNEYVDIDFIIGDQYYLQLP